MIKVSVIIPFYNSEKYIEENLKSVTEQSLKNIEIICVDDGSTDSSVDIVKKFQRIDNRIKLLSQKHSGGGVARNLGLDAACGKYLSFLDADDTFDKRMLEMVYDKCEKLKAEVCIYKFNAYSRALNRVTYQNGIRNDLIPQSEVFSWKDMPNYIFNAFSNCTWNKLFLHSFITDNDIRFQEIYRTNDLLFVCKALVLSNRIILVDEALVNYSIHMDTNCQSTNFIYPFDWYKAFKAMKDYLTEKNIWEQLKKGFLNHALDGAIYNLKSIEFHKTHKDLYMMLKNEGFRELGLEQLSKDDTYPEYKDKWNRMKDIMRLEYEEYLMVAADGYKRELLNCRKNIPLLKDEAASDVKSSITFKTGRCILYIPQKLKHIITGHRR